MLLKKDTLRFMKTTDFFRCGNIEGNFQTFLETTLCFRKL